MLPTLFELGPVSIHAYGLLLAISFIVGIQLALGEGRRRGLPEQPLANLALWIMGLSIVGARLVYVVTHLSAFEGRWLDVFKLWQGGLTLYGGLLAAIIGSFVLVRRWDLSWGSVFDSFAPSVALGEGITRIGCFLNGCCFGRACDLPWGVRFPDHSHAGSLFPESAVHPTQLYLSAVGFLSFAILWSTRKRMVRPGQTFYVFLLIESISRFTIDFFRYYKDAGESVGLFGVSLSLSQVLSLGLLLVAMIGLFGRSRRREVEIQA